VGLFTPYKRADEPGDARPDEPAAAAPASTAAQQKKKAVPTPTRKEAEAARMERLHPTLSAAEQRKRDREARTSAREEQFRRSEERPGRALLRDFLDSRRGMAQWWMPVIMISLALALAAMYVSPEFALVATFVPYVALAALAVHIFLLWRQYKQLHQERLPKEPLKGLLAYLINRIISLRRFRMPAPRVKPGDEI
jgi:Flp pilus assembly protein TadB